MTTEPMLPTLADIARYDATTLGQKLAHLRTLKGWSLREAAAEAGIGHSVLWEYEKGMTDPTARTLKTLATAYGTTVAYLLNEDILIASRMEAIVRDTINSLPNLD